MSWMHWRHLSKQLHHLRSPREDLLYNKSSLVLLINSPDSMNRSHCTFFVACTYLHTSSTFDHILSKNTHCGFADNPLSISPMPIGLHPGFLLSNMSRQPMNASNDDMASGATFSEHNVFVKSAIASGHSLLVWPYLFEARILDQSSAFMPEGPVPPSVLDVAFCIV